MPPAVAGPGSGEAVSLAAVPTPVPLERQHSPDTVLAGPGPFHDGGVQLPKAAAKLVEPASITPPRQALAVRGTVDLASPTQAEHLLEPAKLFQQDVDERMNQVLHEYVAWPCETPAAAPFGASCRPARDTAPRVRAVKALPAAELQAQRTPEAGRSTLLLCDFDKTLTDCDAGECLVGELAPELAPLLSALEMPANFVPVTNTVLAEMARRGVPSEAIIATLRKMGGQMPVASVRLLWWAARACVQVRVLSDCNSVFISHMLAGAKVDALVPVVITNPAAFLPASAPAPNQQAQQQHQRAQQRDAKADGVSVGLSAWCGEATVGAVGGGRAGAACATLAKAAPNRLVITPRWDYATASHGCPLCPANLCKGRELEALRSVHPAARVIYCGDGANDLCPALALVPGDCVLARRGHSLACLLAERRGGPGAAAAAVHEWADHAQLLRLVQSLAA